MRAPPPVPPGVPPAAFPITCPSAFCPALPWGSLSPVLSIGHQASQGGEGRSFLTSCRCPPVVLPCCHPEILLPYRLPS